MNEAAAGVSSTLPKRSIERIWAAWAPTAAGGVTHGEVQGVKAPPSSPALEVEPVLLSPKPIVTWLEVVVAGGGVPMVVWGRLKSSSVEKISPKLEVKGPCHRR